MDAEARAIQLEGRLRPAAALRALRDDERPFALLGDWAGGGALLGSAPVRVAAPGEDPFALLADQPEVEPAGAVVGGGWFGALGYRLGARVEDLPPGPPAPVPVPAHALAFHDHVVRWDGERWWFEALWSAERDAALRERLEVWRRRLSGPDPRSEPVALGAFSMVAPGAPGHVAAVEECVERIAAGEIFQANLTSRLEARWAGHPVDLAARALAAATPRFGALVAGPWGAIVSLSPERFLRRTGRRVVTEPVKGTSRDAAALRASAKDAAEHVMIVDLMRNDLGRVCEYGSISAAQPRLEAYADVWHMVSTVAGELRADVTDADLLRAAFPPGSVTGAPKVQAMKVIARLEATRREAYTGAIGYASPVAGLELNVAIRTFEAHGDRIWLGVGGGIGADSRPEAELREALDKAAGPLDAAGTRAAEPPVAGSSRAARRLPRALDHGPRPDPLLGVMETVLVEDGVPRQLDVHLTRLAHSVAELYEAELPTLTRSRVAAVARGVHGPARLRVVATPSGGGLSLDVATAALGAPETGAGYVPFVLPGGLGAHKWADRRLPDGLAAAAGPGRVPLIVDADGAVLEASWANVWIEEAGALLTPPTDGRILPGVRRAATLACDPRARAEPLDLPRLLAAHATFLTSALRRHPVGAEPVELATHVGASPTRAPIALR